MDITIPLPAAAHPDFIARKVIASGKGGREAVVEAMRADLAWSEARWHRDNPNASADRGQGTAPRLPHEQAAAVAVNCWAHLHSTETRIVSCWTRLHAQRRAGWEATESAADLRWYLGERRKQHLAFNAAVEAYRKLRSLSPAPPHACARVAEPQP